MRAFDRAVKEKDVEKPKKGDRSLIAFGRPWAPIACGPHNADDPVNYEPAEGYQPDCEACQTQLNDTWEAAQRFGGTP